MEKDILSEGGSGGHMVHPFNLPQVKTGKDLIEFFESAAEFVSKKRAKIEASESASIKFDGVNASIKLIDGPGGKEFALDRGSLRPDDIGGVTADKLVGRFSEGHGMIKVGKIMLDIFNQGLPKIKPELEALGLWDDPTKFLNAEFVWKKTNVVKYPEDFIAIHGISQYYEKTHSRNGNYRPGLTRPLDDEGKPVKQVSTEAEYDESALESLKEKIKTISEKFGFNLYTVVPASRKEGGENIDFEPALSTDLTIRFEEKSVTKTIKEWLLDRNVQNPRSKVVTLSDGRRVAAMSKLVYQTLLGGASLADLLADPDDAQDAINGTVLYLATQILGGVILDSLTSPLGDLTGTETEHEGIVLRSKKRFGARPVKITGDFITAGTDSPFRKPEQVDPTEEEEEETIQEQEEDLVGLDTDNPNIQRKIAVFPGKFKPPQKGHLEAVQSILEKVDYVYVMISPLPRSIGEVEVGVPQSKAVWELYLKNAGIGDKVTVIGSPFNSPVQASYAVMDGDVPSFVPRPGDLIVPVASDKLDKGTKKRPGQPDYMRFAKYHEYQPKLPGVIPGNIEDFYIMASEDEEGTINATDFRQALQDNKPIDRFIPDGVNPNDVRVKLGFELSPPVVPPHYDEAQNDLLETILSTVESLLLEGDWQPIAKRRLAKAQKDLLDTGPQNPGKPFASPRPIKKSNAFFAKEGKEEEPEEEELEEVSSMAGGAVEGGATKSPFVNFDEEENHKN